MPPMEEIEEIVEKKPSHPVVTFMLGISALALVFCVYFTAIELGFYMNDQTVKNISAEPPVTAIQQFYKDFPDEVPSRR